MVKPTYLLITLYTSSDFNSGKKGTISIEIEDAETIETHFIVIIYDIEK